MNTNEKITLLMGMRFVILKSMAFGFCRAYLHVKTDSEKYAILNLEKSMLEDIPELAAYKPQHSRAGIYWFTPSDIARRVAILDEIINNLT